MILTVCILNRQRFISAGNGPPVQWFAEDQKGTELKKNIAITMDDLTSSEFNYKVSDLLSNSNSLLSMQVSRNVHFYFGWAIGWNKKKKKIEQKIRIMKFSTKPDLITAQFAMNFYQVVTFSWPLTVTFRRACLIQTKTYAMLLLIMFLFRLAP